MQNSIAGDVLCTKMVHQINFDNNLIEVFFLQIGDGFRDLQFISEFQIRRSFHTFDAPTYDVVMIKFDVGNRNLTDMYLTSYQSNPAAKEDSIAGAMSLAQDVINFSALDFLRRNKQE